MKKSFVDTKWFWIIGAIGVIAFWAIIFSRVELVDLAEKEAIEARQEEENQKEKEEKRKIREEEKQQKEKEKQQNKENDLKVKEEQAKVDKESYILSAQTYDYKELERNPDKTKGEVAIFKGKVIQVSETILNNVVYRVNVNDTSDTIYVTYKRTDDETRILEDDIITIYGDLNGIETYTSVLGGKISIPAIKAKYINIE